MYNLTKEEVLNEITNSKNIMSWDRESIFQFLIKEFGHAWKYNQIKNFVKEHGVDDILDVVSNEFGEQLEAYYEQTEW